jgi:hypothetical protein
MKCWTTYHVLSIFHEFRQTNTLSCHWYLEFALSYAAHNGQWRPSWQASLRWEFPPWALPDANPPSEDGWPPQSGIIGVRVSFQLASLLTWAWLLLRHWLSSTIWSRPASEVVIEPTIDDQFWQVWENQTIWFGKLEYPIFSVSEQDQIRG